MKTFKRGLPREIKDLRDMVLTSAAFFGDKDLYVYKEGKEERHYSYNLLRDEVERFGTALNALGIDGPVISASRIATFFPFLLEEEASIAVTEDFPTPPFPLTIPITFFTLESLFIGAF